MDEPKQHPDTDDPHHEPNKPITGHWECVKHGKIDAEDICHDTEGYYHYTSARDKFCIAVMRCRFVTWHLADTQEPITPPAQSDELKPCPFCGEKGCLIRERESGEWRVECYDEAEEDPEHYCDAGTAWCSTEAEAIAAWNTRPIEDELRQENATLKAMFKGREMHVDLVNADNSKLRAEIANLKDVVASCEDRVLELIAENDNTAEDVQFKVSKIEIDELRAEISRLREEISRAWGVAMNHRDKKLAVKAENDSLKKKVQSLRSLYGGDIDEVNEVVEKLKTENERLARDWNMESKGLNNKIAMVEVDLAAALAENERLRGECEETENARFDLQAKNERLHKQRQELSYESKDLAAAQAKIKQYKEMEKRVREMETITQPTTKDYILGALDSDVRGNE